nr:MAG TPA: hypothetical protein [Caudoviricetes sp.]
MGAKRYSLLGLTPPQINPAISPVMPCSSQHRAEVVFYPVLILF